jgi:glycosyltransferase involved in cell wall biosynthesis
MKILNCIYAQSTGGVDQVFRDYNQVIQDLNHQLAIVISNNSHQNYSQKNIFKLNNYSQIQDLIHFLKIIFSFQPDIIICHSRRLMKWIKIIKIILPKKLIKFQSIAVNHGITIDCSFYCDYIISINQQIRQMVIEKNLASKKNSKPKNFPSKNSFVVHNAINVNQPYQAKTFNYQAPVIGIYGRIEPRKGFDILFNAIAILNQINIKTSLKIGGFEVSDHYNLQTLKNLATDLKIIDQCQFVGLVFDKINFFKDVDIFCVPSTEEPFGLVILEAFLNSTMVISSNTDGGKLLIDHQKNGLLFENQSAKDLAIQIKWMIDHHPDYENFTKQGFQMLKQDYSLSSLKQKLDNIFKQIITKN